VDEKLLVRSTFVHPFHQRFRGLEEGPERCLVQLLHLLPNPYLVDHAGPSLRFLQRDYDLGVAAFGKASLIHGFVDTFESSCGSLAKKQEK
jgi:hypothetical protein